MSRNVIAAVLYIGFFFFCVIMVIVVVPVLRYIYFKTSFHDGLQYCMKQKWIILLFALSETLLIVASEAKILTPYVHYIIPAIASVAVILLAKGTAPAHK